MWQKNGILSLKNTERNHGLVIINDGSKDNTLSLLKELEVDMPLLTVLDKTNSGHGATLLYGYHYALEQGADYIFQTDSDGQTLPEEFAVFWENREKFDAVIGYRNHREDGASRVFVTKVLKLVLRMIFGVKVTDANTPFRLMTRDVLSRYIGEVPHNFNLTNVLLTVFFIKGGEKVHFYPHHISAAAGRREFHQFQAHYQNWYTSI